MSHASAPMPAARGLPLHTRILIGFILVAFHSLAPLLVFWIYAFAFPIRAVIVRNFRPEPEPVSPPVDEHPGK